MLVDTHAHLEHAQFDSDVEDVIARAGDAGVSHIVIIGADLASSRMAIELAERGGFSATVGFHPHVAGSLKEEELSELREMTASDAVVAVGEIGLDYYRDLSPRDVQVEAFRRQLLLAVECRLPVVVHDRNAHDEVASVLSEYADQLRGAVLHCYSGGIELARSYLDLGFYFSVSGQITYRRADVLRETISSLPMEKLLLETDAPYLTPQPVRGRRNEPQFLTHTARCLAELKGMSYDDVCRITTSNAARLFAMELTAAEKAGDRVGHGHS
jgi:TatD DNase family protein